MKHSPKILAAGACTLLLLPCVSYGETLVQYSFGVPGTPTASPTTVAPNLTATPIVGDTGLAAFDFTSPGAVPTAPYLRLTFNGAYTTPAASIANNADYNFTLTADAGYDLDLTSLTFLVEKGGTGTRGYDVRSSVDNYASTLGTATLTDANVRPNMLPVTIDLSAASFQNLPSITFRVYSFSQGTGSSVEYDDVTLNGLVTSLAFMGYTWKGTANSAWDNQSANWTGTGTIYVDNTAASDVLFDDTASVTSVAVVAGGLRPDSVLFSNATKAYSLSGGNLAITTSLSKAGAATTTLNNNVSASSVVVSEGTLALGPTAVLTSSNITVAAAGTLTVDASAILSSTTNLTTSGAVTLNGTTQILGTLAGAGTGTLTLNGTTLNVTAPSSYDGRITGTGSIVKNTLGTLVLNGATSDFSGGITISAGAVQIGGASAGGTGVIIVNSGGTLVLGVPTTTPVTPSTTAVVLAGGIVGTAAGAQTLNNSLRVTAPSTVDIFNPISNNTGNDLIVAGTLEGSGDINLQSRNGNTPDSAAFRLRGPVSTGPNAYSGKITLGPSAKFELQASSTTGSPMGTGTLILTAGTNPTTNTGTYSIVNARNNSAAGVVSDVDFANNVQVTGTGVSYFNLLGSAAAGSTVSFGDLLIGDGQAIGAVATASQAYTVAFATVHHTGGNVTFTPQPVGNTSFVSTENIRLGPITQSTPGANITMNGAATLTLAGTNNYTGFTDVQSGTLNIAATGSIATSSEIRLSGFGSKLDVLAHPSGYTIPSTQTLNGIGDWDGRIVLQGTLAPGPGIGTITGDDLTLDGAGVLQLELSTFDNSSDQVVLFNAFDRGTAGPFRFDFAGGGSNGRDYKLVQFFSTTFSAGDFTYSNLAPGLLGNFVLTSSELHFVVIPEPTASYLALAAASLLGIRRRGRATSHAAP